MALFSLQELDIADDPYILLIKNRIMEKVRALMEELEQDLHHFISNNDIVLPKEINLKHGKISKGENYKNLPFVILDYPAFFSKKDIFAFRTMFYWGHFISFTLHLQGDYAKTYGYDLSVKLREVDLPIEIFFGLNDTPWEYLYKQNNYQLLKKIDDTLIQEQINQNSFIKLSCHLPITEIHHSPEIMMQFFKTCVSHIAPNKKEA